MQVWYFFENPIVQLIPNWSRSCMITYTVCTYHFKTFRCISHGFNSRNEKVFFETAWFSITRFIHIVRKNARSEKARHLLVWICLNRVYNKLKYQKQNKPALKFAATTQQVLHASTATRFFLFWPFQTKNGGERSLDLYSSLMYICGSSRVK